MTWSSCIIAADSKHYGLFRWCGEACIANQPHVEVTKLQILGSHVPQRRHPERHLWPSVAISLPVYGQHHATGSLHASCASWLGLHMCGCSHAPTIKDDDAPIPEQLPCHGCICEDILRNV